MTNEQVYREALEKIITLSDLEMADGDGARAIARQALASPAEPTAEPPYNFSIECIGCHRRVMLTLARGSFVHSFDCSCGISTPFVPPVQVKRQAEPKVDARDDALRFYAERRHLLPSADAWTIDGNTAGYEPGDLQVAVVEDGTVARSALNRQAEPKAKFPALPCGCALVNGALYVCRTHADGKPYLPENRGEEHG